MPLIVQYSPLCDSDSAAYLKYLQVVQDGVSKGQGVYTGYGDGDAGRFLEWRGPCAVGGCGRSSQCVGIPRMESRGSWEVGRKCLEDGVGGIIGEAESVGGSMVGKGGECSSSADVNGGHEFGDSVCGDVTADGCLFQSRPGERSGGGRVPSGEFVKGDVGSGLESSTEFPVLDGEVVFGPRTRTEHNRERRVKARARKLRKKASLDWNVDKDERLENFRKNPRGVQVTAESMELRKSLEAKWKAENELAMLKAQRQVQVLKANDVDGEIRRYRTNVVKQTERNMVQIEKVHGQLRSSGNVSDDMESRVQTVLDPPSLTSASISPDSSASQAEFRAAQKKILDLEAERARMLEQLKKLDITEDQLEMLDKETFTNDTVNNEYVERMYPHYYGASYHVVRDGVTKFKVGYDTTAQW